MSNLKILGAQRVKALQEVADAKMKEELRRFNEMKPSEEQLLLLTAKELGVEDLFKSVQKIEEALQEVASQIKDATGIQYRISKDMYNRPTQQFSDKKRDIIVPFQVQEQAIREKWSNVKNMLWLCQSLEEAKELVGVE